MNDTTKYPVLQNLQIHIGNSKKISQQANANLEIRLIIQKKKRGEMKHSVNHNSKHGKLNKITIIGGEHSEKAKYIRTRNR